MSESGSGVAAPGKPGDRVLDGVIAEEMIEEVIDRLRRVRQAGETRYRAEHPGEGLRARKRRLTRHLIADAATALFASRGFDAVTVSEIADRVNVSMKTLYNYFPTKESMVLDDADELIEGLATALRDRRAGMPVTDAFVGALEANMDGFDLLDDGLAAYVATTFAAMVEQTPALHARWLEIQDRLARVAAEQLALQAGTEPTDPEPTVAGRALVGLVQVDMDSRVRHIRAGLRGGQLRDAVARDVHQAAELLETGLASFSRGTQTGGCPPDERLAQRNELQAH
ncbi:MAG TPA: TetR family transcriptional regulator [Streptosporangiaceae bacterium]|jgi:AcrR family transcriptional regulator